MTTHNYKVLKDYPVQFTVKSPKHYWQTINTTYSEDTTVDVELVPFETLEHTFTNPLITFPRQTLLDGTILEKHTRVLAESGREWTYGDGVTDINVVGTLTEDNGVYSGFTTANYLETDTSPIVTKNGEWEYMVKFTTGSDVTTTQRIVHALPAANIRYGTGFYIANGKMDYIVSFNGSSWGIDEDGKHTLSPNTTYWVRFSCKNQKYLGEISTDGVTFEEDYAVSNANTLKSPLPVLRFGVSYSTKFEFPFLGSIDLKECYFKTGDRILWDYSHTKYYMGCLRSMMDVPNERTYNVDIVDGEAVLTTGNNKGLWGGQITIPAHDVVISYFPTNPPI